MVDKKDPPASVDAIQREALIAGLEAIRPFCSPHSEHTYQCNGGDEEPCDCYGICPRQVVDQMLSALRGEDK